MKSQNLQNYVPRLTAQMTSANTDMDVILITNKLTSGTDYVVSFMF